MNDKDKEAFRKCRDMSEFYASCVADQKTALVPEDVCEGFVAGWQAACEYKQKEIEELKNVTYWTVEQDGKVTRHISIAEIEKLQDENAKMREYLEFTTHAAEYLYRPDVKLNKGMTPTFYFTLTYEGDLELMENLGLKRREEPIHPSSLILQL